MVRVILKHLTGYRASEVDTVPLGAHTELILGAGGAFGSPGPRARAPPSRSHPVFPQM
jgi:hypothetical protein